jgi:hypothetical protein
VKRCHWHGFANADATVDEGKLNRADGTRQAFLRGQEHCSDHTASKKTVVVRRIQCPLVTRCKNDFDSGKHKSHGAIKRDAIHGTRKSNVTERRSLFAKLSDAPLCVTLTILATSEDELLQSSLASFVRSAYSLFSCQVDRAEVLEISFF